MKKGNARHANLLQLHTRFELIIVNFFKNFSGYLKPIKKPYLNIKC